MDHPVERIARQAEEILALAMPFYELGRESDVAHIRWMLDMAPRFADVAGVRMSILIPLVILHDIGYSAIPDKNPDPKDVEVKLRHMKEGAPIARRILNEVGYEDELALTIVELILLHDIWITGDDSPYKGSVELSILNDLDFIWAQTSSDRYARDAVAMGKRPDEMYLFWMTDEKLSRRPFCCQASERLFQELVRQRLEDMDANRGKA